MNNIAIIIDTPEEVLIIIVYFLSMTIRSGLIVKLFTTWKKAEKLARPMLLSLLLYFSFILAANVILLFYNLESQFFQIDLGEIGDPIINIMGVVALLLIIIGPVDLIFQVEKRSLKQPIYNKKHLLFIIHIILILLMALQPILAPLMIPSIDAQQIARNQFGLFALVLLMDVIFFEIVFINLSNKAPKGPYKTNLRLIALGYLLNFCGSIVTIIVPGIINRLFAFFFLSIIGSILLAFGFIKLYSLRETE